MSTPQFTSKDSVFVQAEDYKSAIAHSGLHLHQQYSLCKLDVYECGPGEFKVTPSFKIELEQTEEIEDAHNDS